MLFTKFREINLMNHIIQANSNNILFTIYPSINNVQEGSTKYNGTKAILWRSENKKSAGYLVFPHKTSTYLTIPIGEIVSLLASLIVTSIPSNSAGAISCLISSYKVCGITLALAPISHKT